ncbi:MAG: hypothetical protein AAF628_12535 [Planctomycetota bacterium]
MSIGRPPQRLDSARTHRAVAVVAVFAALETAGCERPPRQPDEAKAGAELRAARTEAIDRLDWPAIGAATRWLLERAPRLVGDLRQGVPPPASLLHEIANLDQLLVVAAAPLAESPVPGSGLTGRFTYPPVVVRHLEAMLAAAGHPLTAAQRSELSVRAERIAHADDRRRAAYDATTPRLRELVGEAGLKDDFYTAVSALLAPEQHAAVSPPALRGLTAIDLFGVGVVWAPFLVPLQATDRAELTAAVAARWRQELGLARAVAIDVTAIIERGMSEVNAELCREESTPIQGVGKQLYAVELVRQCSRAQAAIAEAVLRGVSLTPAARERLLALESVFVPLARH